MIRMDEVIEIKVMPIEIEAQSTKNNNKYNFLYFEVQMANHEQPFHPFLNYQDTTYGSSSNSYVPSSHPPSNYPVSNRYYSAPREMSQMSQIPYYMVQHFMPKEKKTSPDIQQILAVAYRHAQQAIQLKKRQFASQKTSTQFKLQSKASAFKKPSNPEVIVLSDDDEVEEIFNKKIDKIQKQKEKASECNIQKSLLGSRAMLKMKKISKQRLEVPKEKKIKKMRQNVEKEIKTTTSLELGQQKRVSERPMNKAPKPRDNSLTKIMVGKEFQAEIPRLTLNDQGITVWREQKRTELINRLLM